MVVGLEMLLPAFLGLKVLPRFNDDGVGKVPFQGGPIKLVFVRDEVLAQDRGLEFGRGRDHAQPQPTGSPHARGIECNLCNCAARFCDTACELINHPNSDIDLVPGMATEMNLA